LPRETNTKESIVRYLHDHVEWTNFILTIALKSSPRKVKELNQILEASGIDCARFRASHTYSVTTIKARIEQHLAPVQAIAAEHPDARYMPSNPMA